MFKKYKILSVHKDDAYHHAFFGGQKSIRGRVILMDAEISAIPGYNSGDFQFVSGDDKGVHFALAFKLKELA
jgi:hypothetical protein